MVFSPVGEGASQTSQPLVRMVDLQVILRENDGRETIPTNWVAFHPDANLPQELYKASWRGYVMNIY